jgi:tRNA-dihydrouridine synthase 1
MINAKVSQSAHFTHSKYVLLTMNAQMFASEKARKGYWEQNFNIPNGEEGGSLDRPLIVQFCANDVDHLLESAKVVEALCDAVDINLECPQDIARKGHYGAFLQDEWDLIYNLSEQTFIDSFISPLICVCGSQYVAQAPLDTRHCEVPCLLNGGKDRQVRSDAGAQILTCHVRTREQRGHASVRVHTQPLPSSAF